MSLRRAYHRFLVNSETSIITEDGKEKRVLLQNLSSEGAAVVVDTPPDKTKKIRLYINAPSIIKEPINIEATVIWAKEIDKNLWRVGLGFGINKLNMPDFYVDKGVIVKKFKRNNSILKVAAFLLSIILISILVYLGLSLRTVTLQGVSYEPDGKSRALVNNEFVFEGDNIGNIKIEKINEDSIVIKIEDKRRPLKLKKTLIYFQR